MRSRLRLHSITPLTFLAAILLLSSATCVRAQTQPSLPKSWDDAVKQLAGKVASAVSPSVPVELNFENSSALDAASAGAIESAMKSALESHSFHLVSPGAIAAKVPVRLAFTLSESVASYVWVVRMVSEAANVDSFSPAIVSVSKSDSFGNRSGSEYVSLEKRVIWKQPRQFLDFALLPNSSSADSELVVLEATRLAVYEMSGAEWQLSHTSAIPQTGLVSRNPSGEIDARSNSFRVAGSDCAGEPDLAGTIHCRATKTPEARVASDQNTGVQNGVGSTVTGVCPSQAIYLGSGDGDWTQADAVQAYRVDAISTAATPSGSPLPVPGPVLALHGEPDANSVRVVVHNLKTGDYEAYLVTATCSH